MLQKHQMKLEALQMINTNFKSLQKNNQMKIIFVLGKMWIIFDVSNGKHNAGLIMNKEFKDGRPDVGIFSLMSTTQNYISFL